MRATYGVETEVPLNWKPMLRREETAGVIEINDRLVIESQILFVRWAEINAAAAGDNTILNGIGGRKLTVISIDFVVAAAVSLAWLSAATTKRNAQAFAANSGLARDLVRPFYVQTNPGDSLIMNLSAAVSVRGAVGYVEVEA